jgi:membrane protein implicated in regulation of membrane protease activity
VTWGFAYLLVFLGGFTLALVSGLARRLLHPSELCDFVVVPSHEHLNGLRFPAADLLASFLAVSGLASLLVHGLTSFPPTQEIAVGVGAGIVGTFTLKFWLNKVCDPSDQLQNDLQKVKVVREIPANGYGQVEVPLEGALLKLAARSEAEGPIPEGTLVQVLDRRESVVIVKPSAE